MVESDFTNLVLIFIFGAEICLGAEPVLFLLNDFPHLGKLRISRTWPTKGRSGVIARSIFWSPHFCWNYAQIY